jgi:hypothetical protein
MRSVLTLVLTALIALQATPSLAQTAPGGTSVAVPGGTPLQIRRTAPISSGYSHVDDSIRFKAVDNVVIDGWIVIAKDALGEGTVTAIDAAGSHGHPGQIKAKFDWIYGADGLKIRLSNVAETNNGEGAKGTATTATVLSTVLLGPIGLFAHNFVKGKDVTIDTSAKIPIYVADTVHIDAKSRPSKVDEFAH